MIKICEADKCTGCEACRNICPMDAVCMRPDEKGFLHPQIGENCIHCGKCVQICPQNKAPVLHKPGKVYAALARDDAIRSSSSSGGIFSLLADKVLQNGGSVFGAVVMESLTVRHIGITDTEGLERLRGSKYVQSEIDTTYQKAKEYLIMERAVLFSGTPCQIAGLYAYLGEDYENLLTVDILCHGVASPAVYQKFLDAEAKSIGSEITGIFFRKKIPGWKKNFLVLNSAAGQTRKFSMNESYLSGFLKDLYLRDSCYQCPYACTGRSGDITLGDYWGYRETGPEYIEDDDLGISFVMTNTEKGRAIFQEIQPEIAVAKRSVEDASRGNPILTRANEKPNESEAFWKDFNSMQWSELCSHYFPGVDGGKDIFSPERREYYKQPFNNRHPEHRREMERIEKERGRRNWKQYILYGHDGAGNHGCEALVRTAVSALDLPRERIILASQRPGEDLQYDLDRLAVVKDSEEKAPINRKSVAFIKAYAALKLRHDYLPLDYLEECAAFDLKKSDVAISIGGDTYCYGESWKSRAEKNRMYRFSGVKTVLWGVSIEPELLAVPELVEDIRGFDLITARETISYEALKAVNPKTILTADGAFTLPVGDAALPKNFDNCALVGINASPMIEENETVPGMARQNYINLIRWILNETTMKILLVPHVEWVNKHGFSDRTVMEEMQREFRDSDRIFLVEDCECEKVKGYISKCRFFVGARTHATIAAYSQCIPTLVLGYSVKSKGIARDLFGTEEHYVLPVQELKSESDLTEAFRWIADNEIPIRERLQKMMPEYRSRYQAGIDALKQL